MAIGREAHQDGTPHLHAVVVLAKKFDTRDPRCLDIMHELKPYHGDYQAMKGGLMKAVKYATKNDKAPYFFNINMESLQKATESKKKYFGRQLAEGEQLEDLM